jgi:hypothetical protein
MTECISRTFFSNWWCAHHFPPIPTYVRAQLLPLQQHKTRRFPFLLYKSEPQHNRATTRHQTATRYYFHKRTTRADTWRCLTFEMQTVSWSSSDTDRSRFSLLASLHYAMAIQNPAVCIFNCPCVRSRPENRRVYVAASTACTNGRLCGCRGPTHCPIRKAVLRAQNVGVQPSCSARTCQRQNKKFGHRCS